MADDTQTAPVAGRSHIAAAGGVAAGAGISTALFSKIGIAKILSSPGDYSAAYPLVIFCLAALFILTATLMTIQINRDQRMFALVGVACFGFIVLAGVSIIFWQDAVVPKVTVTEMFEPADLMGTAAEPKLQILYHSAHNPQVDYAPYKTNTFPITGGDVIAFRVDGLSKLVADYNAMRLQSGMQAKLLINACKSAPTSLLCQNISVLDAPPES